VTARSAGDKGARRGHTVDLVKVDVCVGDTGVAQGLGNGIGWTDAAKTKDTEFQHAVPL
jgi:hypothetical protein